MASTGIDARTGKVLRDYDHVLQSVATIFTTRLGERIMFRWLFADLPRLLGKPISARNVSIYIALLTLALRTYEPRLRIIEVRADGNTVESVRLGELRFELRCYYLPNALDGDFTIEGGMRRVGVASNNNTFSLQNLGAAA